MSRLKFILVLCALVITLPACTLASASVPTPHPTATSLRMPATTAVPTLARALNPVTVPASNRNTATPTDPAPSVAVTTCTPAADAITQHVVNVQLDYTAKTIQARHRVEYVNRTGETLNDLVLNIEPNRWLETFTLIGVLQDTDSGDTQPAYDLTGRRLYIELAEPLADGCTLTLNMMYSINIPPVRTGVDAFKGFFGYSPRQINLGHWLPTVAERISGEWVTRPAIFVGEQEVIGVADWTVTLALQNAPDGVIIAAPGDAETINDTQTRYTFKHARDFTVSIGEGFKVARAQAESGVVVELYTFDDAVLYTANGVIDGANHALNVGLRAFESYEKLFGAYPYSRLLIVQGDFPDGMEFSGIVFVSTNWFKAWTGQPNEFLTLITVHEVSHQWWYARVGNDAALAPWLDEALSTYSEYIFLEEYYPNLKDWWWDFRVRSHSPQGFVDSTVYEFTSIREYINAVYLRGVSMLHAVRNDIGTEAFFELLRRYAEENTNQVADASRFWSLMTPEQLKVTENTRRVFLRHADFISAGTGGG